MIRDVLEKVSPVCFSEWESNLMQGYDHSYSGLASRASMLGLIRLVVPWCTPLGARTMVWDSPTECSPPHTKIDYETGHFMTVSHRDFTTDISACIPEYLTQDTKKQDYVTCMMKSVDISFTEKEEFQMEREHLMQSVLRLRALVNSSVAADDDMQPLQRRTILRNKPCHGNLEKYCTVISVR